MSSSPIGSGFLTVRSTRRILQRTTTGLGRAMTTPTTAVPANFPSHDFGYGSGVFKFISRIIKLGLVATFGAAVAAKFMLQSNAEPQTQEVDMVAIFGGEDLASAADPFYGGKILTMFGGTRLDLRNAQPAPTGIYLDIAVIAGGLELIIPQGWRVEFSGRVIAGGFDDITATDANPAAIRVHVGGFVVAGGVRAMNRSDEEAAAE